MSRREERYFIYKRKHPCENCNKKCMTMKPFVCGIEEWHSGETREELVNKILGGLTSCFKSRRHIAELAVNALLGDLQ